MPSLGRKEFFKRVEAFDPALEIIQSDIKTLIKDGDTPEIATNKVLAASNLVVAHNINHVGATIHHIGNRLSREFRSYFEAFFKLFSMGQNSLSMPDKIQDEEVN